MDRLNDTRRRWVTQVRQTFLGENGVDSGTGWMLCMEQREELSVAPRFQVVGGARRTEITITETGNTDGGRK